MYAQNCPTELTQMNLFQCSHQGPALWDSLKENWDGALKAKKMRPFERRGKLLVKRTLE